MSVMNSLYGIWKMDSLWSGFLLWQFTYSRRVYVKWSYRIWWLGKRKSASLESQEFIHLPERIKNEPSNEACGINTRGRWHTVQTFNSCTIRPDVCQSLAVQRPIDNMSNNRPSTPMTHVACESKLLSFVRSSMPRKRGGNRVCGRVLCPGSSHILCRN